MLINGKSIEESTDKELFDYLDALRVERRVKTEARKMKAKERSIRRKLPSVAEFAKLFGADSESDPEPKYQQESETEETEETEKNERSNL